MLVDCLVLKRREMNEPDESEYGLEDDRIADPRVRELDLTGHDSDGGGD